MKPGARMLLGVATAALIGFCVVLAARRVHRDLAMAQPASPPVAPIPPPLAQLVARLEADRCAELVAIGPNGEVFVTEGDRILLVQPVGPPKLFAGPSRPERDEDCKQRSAIESIVADAGVVYAARGRDILRFSIPDGASLPSIAGHPPDLCPRALAAEPGGTLLVVSDCSEPILYPPGGRPVGMVRLDRNGVRLSAWRCCAGDERVAVDASGAIDWLRPFGDSVASATSTGQVAFHIGGRDDTSIAFPGGTRALAADRDGHLFVLDGEGGVEVIDALGGVRGDVRGRFGPGTEHPPRRGARALAIGPTRDAYLLVEGVVERYEMSL